MVNDVSGLRDERLAEVCARTGAALVLMHTRVAPKGTLLRPGRLRRRRGGRRRRSCASGWRSRWRAGVAPEQIVLDPGPDFAKTPAQTVAVLRRLDLLAALGRPLLLAVSRKDFLGAITGRAPRERGAATLAALDFGVRAGAAILRVHDVAAAADFLAVRAVLSRRACACTGRRSDARSLPDGARTLQVARLPAAVSTRPDADRPIPEGRHHVIRP